MDTQTETMKFEAEVQEVLSLVIHSLYSHRDIFLRELVSNASDALDKLRFSALQDDSLLPEGETLGIALEVDKDERLLVIADNGIGMTREELVENLGTIASSGTKRFLAAMQEQGMEQAPDLIGQFGVGFYSAFMVAERVTLVTRKAGSDEAWRWSSTGDGEYSLETASEAARGTVITLKLREVGEGEADFSAEWTLREVIKRYSDFVEYPIQMEVERSVPKLGEDGEPIEGETELRREMETLNSMRPLWARSKESIEDEEYKEFYQHLTHDWSEPRETIHFKAEGKLEFTSLLYIPGQAPADLFDPTGGTSRLSLYVRRVLIMRDCEELLPAWLRFVQGVVESSDLPLNVSRETLQDNPGVRQIHRSLTKKVLERLGKLMEGDRTGYEEFWGAFGAVLKEGIHFGADDDGRLTRLCLFQSSVQEGWTSLEEYVSRMPEEQEAIHVLTGPNRKALEASPHLEGLAAKGQEVLLLTDAVDEWVLQRLREFDGKDVRSIDRGDAADEDEKTREKREARQEENKDLLAAIQTVLDEHVKEVRFTGRLKGSAAVLVGDEFAMGVHIERMLRRSGNEVPIQKRVLEINPDHELVVGLTKLHGVDESSPRIGQYAELLYGQALIAEGSPLEDPARFTTLVTDLMVESVKG